MQSALHYLRYADEEADRYAAAGRDASGYTAANGDSQSHTRAIDDITDEDAVPRDVSADTDTRT